MRGKEEIRRERKGRSEMWRKIENEKNWELVGEKEWGEMKWKID